jgi:hypothetical protein
MTATPLISYWRARERLRPLFPRASHRKNRRADLKTSEGMPAS